MSDWYTEAKKPMAGKLGAEIERISKEEIVCPNNVERFAKKLNKKYKVKKDFLISEVSRHHDFHNGWSGDDRYTHYADNKDVCKLESISPPKGDRHWWGHKITSPKEMSAWMSGYHTASGNCYDRFNNLMLLITMYLEQENAKV